MSHNNYVPVIVVTTETPDTNVASETIVTTVTKITTVYLSSLLLLQTFADMFVLVCSIRESVTFEKGVAMTIACISGKGHDKNRRVVV